jgi:hypothetical protein
MTHTQSNLIPNTTAGGIQRHFRILRESANQNDRMSVGATPACLRTCKRARVAREPIYLQPASQPAR